MSSSGPNKGSQAVAQMPGYNEGTYQFATLVLMMYIRSIHNKINYIYERALRLYTQINYPPLRMCLRKIRQLKSILGIY